MILPYKKYSDDHLINKEEEKSVFQIISMLKELKGIYNFPFCLARLSHVLLYVKMYFSLPLKYVLLILYIFF